ncbi:DUF1565 domain-containing protein [Albimonas sp. CAU 1670]|uniref:DUF1565 domain-containing protein n=1 Tax=Albimonas sp. CAU 1670 TaxID=3032599 RepID=UPI0023DA475D|nr:DUF1565 domain-containing protein [Albimonas sp. CAU 1670]MDF2231634.1 DUF1565 domain-containing protein [Albimonas sp. CAU 1670]
MATLPALTYFWRPVGAADDAWTEAPGGSFQPGAGVEVEVVSLGPSRARSIVADTTPAAGALAAQDLQAGTSGVIDAGAVFTGANLVFALLDAPGWASIDPDTGAIAWSAPAAPGAAGTWRVRAGNSSGAAEIAFAVEVVATPASVEWSPAGDIFPVKAYYTPATGEFSTDYDAAAYAYAGPNVLHVSASAGDDGTGDGSSGAPYATIGKAILEAGAAETRIEIAAGRYPENLGVISGKTLTLIGTGEVIVGAFLGSADVTWTDGSGVAGAGAWKATPASGSVSNMIDLTLTRLGRPQVALRRQGNAIFQAALDAGVPAIWTGSSLAYIAASDRRDIRGEEDATIVLVSSTPHTVTLASSAIYVRGVIFAGVTLGGDAASAFVAEDCVICSGGGADNTDFAGGATIYVGCLIGGGFTGDACDYGGGVGVEIGCVVGLCGSNSANNASTGHGSAVLSINSVYEGASRTVNDIGAGVRVMGGCTVGGFQIDDAANIMAGLSGATHAMTMHLAGITHHPDAVTDLFVGDGGSATVYDDYAGWTVTTEGTGAVAAGTLPS